MYFHLIDKIQFRLISLLRLIIINEIFTYAVLNNARHIIFIMKLIQWRSYETENIPYPA